MDYVIGRLLFQAPIEPTPLDEKNVIWLETKAGFRIPACYIKYPHAKYTILYSHGNAEDLGMIYPFLADLGRVLKISILAYDYTGYGLSTVEAKNMEKVKGQGLLPCEEYCYADITAAYDFLRLFSGVPPANIILYGRSLGSGPSCYLAQKLCGKNESKPGIGGLVLHSAFLSVCRVVVDLGFTVGIDVFPNINRMPEIGCPVYLIHGTVDEIVPFYHGEQLFKAIQERHAAMPFWAEKMGHNDIEVKMPTAFIKRLHRFVVLIEKQSRGRTLLLSQSSSLEKSNSVDSEGNDKAQLQFSEKQRSASPSTPQRERFAGSPERLRPVSGLQRQRSDKRGASKRYVSSPLRKRPERNASSPHRRRSVGKSCPVDEGRSPSNSRNGTPSRRIYMGDGSLLTPEEQQSYDAIRPNLSAPAQ